MIDERDTLSENNPRFKYIRFFEVEPYPSEWHQLHGKSYVVVDTYYHRWESVMFHYKFKLSEEYNESVEISKDGTYFEIETAFSEGINWTRYEKSTKPIIRELTRAEFSVIIMGHELSR